LSVAEQAAERTTLASRLGVVADMQDARPRFFVDAVRRGAFGFSDRQAYGHERFAPVSDLLTRDYRFAGELGRPGDGYRLYVLNEPTVASGDEPR